MPRKFKYCKNQKLYEQLSKLDTLQFKIFYGIFVFCWANKKCFISDKHFFNLWCEFNQLCHDLDESFPDSFDDCEMMKSFWHYHPYYFIDHLPLDFVSHLFAEYVDNQVDVLTNVCKIILEQDIKAAYSYVTKLFEIDESVDSSVELALNHIEHCS